MHGSAVAALRPLHITADAVISFAPLDAHSITSINWIVVNIDTTPTPENVPSNCSTPLDGSKPFPIESSDNFVPLAECVEPLIVHQPEPVPRLLERWTLAFVFAIPLTFSVTVIAVARPYLPVPVRPIGRRLLGATASASLILTYGNLAAAGVTEATVVAAAVVQRLFTAYIPPVVGWYAPPRLAECDFS